MLTLEEKSQETEQFLEFPSLILLKRKEFLLQNLTSEYLYWYPRGKVNWRGFLSIFRIYCHLTNQEVIYNAYI